MTLLKRHIKHLDWLFLLAKKFKKDDERRSSDGSL